MIGLRKIAAKALSTLAVTASVICAPAQGATSSPVIREAIIDPSLNTQRTAADWDAIIAEAKESGFTSITFAYTVKRNSNGTMNSYFSSTVPGTASGGSNDILGTLLPILKKYDMHIRLGLFSDAQWSDRLAPAKDDADLTKKIVVDLWNRYWNYYPIIDGWYLPGEVNTNFAYGDKRVALAEYYRDISEYVHTRANNMSVMISPRFDANAGLSPANWTAFWTDVLNTAPIDIIALQDSISDSTWSQNPQAQAQMDADLITWFAATKTAIMQSSRPGTQLWDDINLYKATGSGTYANLNTLMRNVGATRNSVSRYTSFGWFSAFSPWTTGTSTLNRQFAQWNLAGQ
jgi:hypothetical protein